jgi:hypothetical protein
VSGEPVQPGQGGRGQGDGQLRAPALSGGVRGCSAVFPVPDRLRLR